MPPKKRSTEADGESLVWSDEEIGLLLEAIKAYKAQHDVEWESVKDEYEDIRSRVVGCTLRMTVFTRDKIARRIKDMRKQFRKALYSGRMGGGGRTVAAFYDARSAICLGADHQHGLESSLVSPDERQSTWTAVQTPVMVAVLTPSQIRVKEIGHQL